MRLIWADRQIFDKIGHSCWIEGRFFKIPHTVGLIFLHTLLLHLQNLLFGVGEMHFSIDKHIEAITDIVDLVYILSWLASLVLNPTTDLQQSFEVLRNVLKIWFSLQQISNSPAFLLIPGKRWTCG